MSDPEQSGSERLECPDPTCEWDIDGPDSVTALVEAGRHADEHGQEVTVDRSGDGFKLQYDPGSERGDVTDRGEPSGELKLAGEFMAGGCGYDRDGAIAALEDAINNDDVTVEVRR